MAAKHVYKVVFHNQGKVYEIYAEQVSHETMLGFVEVANLLFGTRSALVVDPSEERLKNEFSGVSRSYIPVHSIIRIDEVEQQGTAKVTSAEGDSNVTPFPTFYPPRND